jgi:hypothetical protein
LKTNLEGPVYYVCKRDAMVVMENISGTAQQSAPLPLGVQQVVDSLSLLMATARHKDSKSGVENVDVAGATGANLGRAKEHKCNNQGGGKKRSQT